MNINQIKRFYILKMYLLFLNTLGVLMLTKSFKKYNRTLAQ